MKILEVKELAFPEVKVIKFQRFQDQRGYFTETWRLTDLLLETGLGIPPTQFVQANEAFSLAGVIRGLHFQWDQPMGKLVRLINGIMIELIVDIRKDSPTYGKGICYPMSNDLGGSRSEWIWVPPGFAHGNAFSYQSTVEYLCTAQYNPLAEYGICPIDPAINWDLSVGTGHGDANWDFKMLVANAIGPSISETDREAPTLQEWTADPRSAYFRYP